MKPTTLHLTLLLSISLLKGISANEKTPWLDEKFVNQKTVGLSKLESSNPAQWRVIWKTDPANKATVSWTTAMVGKNHLVHYDLKSRKGFPRTIPIRKFQTVTVAFLVPAASIFIMPDLPSSNLLQLIGSSSSLMVIFHRKCISLRHRWTTETFPSYSEAIHVRDILRELK